jgi:hypothetical protein
VLNALKAEINEVKTMLTEQQSKCQPWQADVQSRLCEVQLGVVKLQLDGSNSQHIATTAQAQRDAEQAQMAMEQVQMDAEQAHTDAELRVRKAIPVFAGEDFHGDCVHWLRSIGMPPTVDTHLDAHSGDVILTLPGRELRVLVDFKASDTMDQRSVHLIKLASDFNSLAANRAEPERRCDFAMLLYLEGAIKAGSGYGVDPCCASNPSNNGGYSMTGTLREDRTFVCTRSTFVRAVAGMLDMVPIVAVESKAAAFQHESILRLVSLYQTSCMPNFGPILKECAKLAPHSADWNLMDKTTAQVKNALVSATQVSATPVASINAAQVKNALVSATQVSATQVSATPVASINAAHVSPSASIEAAQASLLFAVNATQMVYLSEAHDASTLNKTCSQRGKKGEFEWKHWFGNLDSANAKRLEMNPDSTPLTMAALPTLKPAVARKRALGD